LDKVDWRPNRCHAGSDSAAFFGAVVSLIFAALVLMVAGIMVKGLRVKGFVPALIGAVAIAIASWLIDGVVGLLF